ncbi:helix-turn-helix transcriptional regulator [Pseudomonas mosselii]|nr:XRE family transcriptional regulator [Pseudomonas mosselii]MBH3308988.1 helix-turn-helix transcriptional regulator [Pseudomonas mosselii]MBH3324013.1 helix-turn-helix transcriptional regulator [Pseudomonas mosselii]
MSTRTLAQIITEGRERLRLNQSELARQLSVTPQSVQAWESGRSTPRPSKFQALSKALGIPGHVLLKASGMTGAQSTTEFLEMLAGDGLTQGGEAALSDLRVWDESTPLDDDEIFVPLLREVELSAGSGRFAIEEQPTSKLRFSKQDLRANGVQFSNAKCVSVTGSSMLPVLRDGATVGVNVGKNQLTDIVDGEMYAISHNGQLRIKQVFRLPSGLRMRSFNRDDYPDEDYSFQQLQNEQISILGHVFWWGMFA